MDSSKWVKPDKNHTYTKACIDSEHDVKIIYRLKLIVRRLFVKYNVT